MDGPLNSVVGDWTGFECRDDIYVDTLYPEIRTDEIYGKPHSEYMCVRVAGTNGKGSTTRMIAWTLQEQGYDVGMMSNISTTKKLTDTIKYNGNDIPESKLKNICMDVASVATEDTEPYGIRTIVAFEWFRQKNVDIAVIESGVCSQYDATNIVDPNVYAVTNIGFDHKDSVDGRMIDDFATGAKGSECVVTNCSDDMLKMLQDLCDTEVNPAPSRARLIGPKDDLSYDCELQNEIFETELRARYQQENLNTAIEVLNQLELDVHHSSIRKMLSDFRFAGRAEMIKDRILLDGAHNIDGIRVLVETLAPFEKNVIIVFTALEDKLWRDMLQMLNAVSDDIIITKPQGGKRDSHTRQLQDRDERYIENPLNAVKRAMEIKDKNDLIVVTGSLYMIREVRGELLSENI